MLSDFLENYFVENLILVEQFCEEDDDVNGYMFMV